MFSRASVGAKAKESNVGLASNSKESKRGPLITLKGARRCSQKPPLELDCLIPMEPENRRVAGQLGLAGLSVN